MHLGERAKGILGGFMRRGPKDHRSSSASLDTGNDHGESMAMTDLKSHSVNSYDHTPLPAATPMLHAKSLDFHHINEAQQMLQRALTEAAVESSEEVHLKSNSNDRDRSDRDRADRNERTSDSKIVDKGDTLITPRSSLNHSENDVDDIGPLVTLDPLSRYSSISDISYMNHMNHMPFGINQFNSHYPTSIFAQSQDTPENLPPRPPSALSGPLGGSMGPVGGPTGGPIGGSIASIPSSPGASPNPAVKTWFPQFDNPDNPDSLPQLQSKHAQMTAYEALRSPKRNSFTATPEKAMKRGHGSLTSIGSVLSTTSSPDKAPHEGRGYGSYGGDRASGRFFVGKSGFERESDRKIPVFMRSTFRSLDGKRGVSMTQHIAHRAVCCYCCGHN